MTFRRQLLKPLLDIPEPPLSCHLYSLRRFISAAAGNESHRAHLGQFPEVSTRFGAPEILNTDQGSQFTSIDFITALKDANIRISMDGKGAWRDNVFVERL